MQNLLLNHEETQDSDFEITKYIKIAMITFMLMGKQELSRLSMPAWISYA